VAVKDRDKTKEQIIAELVQARQELADLRSRDAAYAAERKQIEQECEWLMTEVDAQRRQVAGLIQALRQERDTLQTIMENTRTCLAYLDHTFNYLRINTAYAASSGRPVGALLGRNHFDLFPDAETRAIFEQVRRSDQGVWFHAHPFRFAGQAERGITYWDWSLVPVKSESGEVQALVLSLLDVTEREHLLEQLAAERARLKAVIENAPEGIVVVDDASRVILANPAADHIFGQRISYGRELGRQHNRRLAHPDGTPFEPGEIPLTGAALAGEVQTDLEVSLQLPGGLRRDLLANTAPIRDRRGQIAGAMIVFQDITQRKEMEKALRRHNRDLNLMNRISQALTANLDLPQVIDQLLEATAEIVGAEGSAVWLWDGSEHRRLSCQGTVWNGQRETVSPPSLEPGQGLAGWVALHGESIAVPDVRLDPRFSEDIDKRTGLETRSALAVPLRGREGIIGTLEAVNKREGTFDRNDVTLAETLAGAGAVAVENARLVDALRVRNEELGAFAHTVAHDLKQPLAVLLGYADLLRDDELVLAPDELRRHLKVIGRIGHKMQSIVEALLLLAEVRQQEVERVPVDMEAVVAEALQRLEPLIADAQACVTVLDGEAWPAVLGHDRWLEQVWVNYVSNAVKYGGHSPRVELGAAAEPGGMARFWVRDYGPGIAPNEQAQLFVPFSRLDGGPVGGHGLGLSIVQRIVEKLGGRVGLESAGLPGEGATFFFTLPAVPAGQEGQDDDSPAHQELF
jgi:PAS domain S-box-containing protein